MLKTMPRKNPKPDGKEFIDILMGRSTNTRTPLVEYIVDDVVMKPIVTEILGRAWVDMKANRDSQQAYLDNFIEFWYRMGYDFVRYEEALPFPNTRIVAKDTGADKAKDRLWVDLHRGAIMSWEDFEKYPWPKIEEMDFFTFEYINHHLPEGMGFMTCHGAGIFEHLSQLMSYEQLSFALYDQPDLVQAIADRVGELILKFYEHLLDLDRVIAIFQGDDMGFRTGTLIAPDDLRKYILPWHKKFAALVQENNRPYFLHSCGNLEAIMEDLISDVGIDGKHSYEDVIIPVHKFQQKYGDRIAVLGGLDINILTEGTPDQVREKTRCLIETCGSRGRYAVGSGNSIPSYIPVENYLAMVNEAAGCSR
ncbi:MAG TPA: uroporphyrinogen decarboxylase family protein [bacterium]